VSTPGQLIGQLVYQASPIVLTRGIATPMGGALPIVALTEGANFLATALSGGNPVDLNNLFANYVVLSGSTLIANQIGMYPFANQTVAANAIIAQPLAVSLMMRVPAKGAFGFAVKLATMTALQKILSQHSLSGGTYSVITPAYIYTDALLVNVQDSGEDDTQQQHSYRLDFIQPLVSLQAAQNAQNGLMQQITAGSQITGTPTWSGYPLTVGNATSVLTSGLVPSSQ
jgi:hypothetical protein